MSKYVKAEATGQNFFKPSDLDLENQTSNLNASQIEQD